jgi:hypothetical protein
MTYRPANLPDLPDYAATQPERLVAIAQRLCRTLGLARALAQSGRRVDIGGIEDGVGLLCAQTMDLPRDQGRLMLPVLCEVLGQVDALSGVLRSAATSGVAPL